MTQENNRLPTPNEDIPDWAAAPLDWRSLPIDEIYHERRLTDET